MIRKVVNKVSLKDSSCVKKELAYWLSKTAEERIEAVETLRRQMDGSSERLQRTVKVIQRAQG
jgi:ribosome-binding ATPase YchF (GTP1/OBG family)